jgi:Alginate export
MSGIRFDHYRQGPIYQTIMLPRRHLIVAFLFAATTAFAQEKKIEPAASTQPATPPPAFTFGGDVRLRYEAYDSVQTLNKDVPFHIRDYYRLRTRAWATYAPTPELSFSGRVAAEPRYWLDNSTLAGEGREMKYAIADNLYVKWSTQAGTTPITVVAGRQDITLGDQWLVSDGTPLDGTWSQFFDAARVTFNFKGIKTKVDVVALNQQAHPSDNLPILGRQGAYFVTDQDEIGAILYASNQSLKNITLDGYLIYKEDKKVAAAGNNGVTNTLGARIAGTPSANWQYTVEGAYQWGHRDLPVRYPVAITRSRDVAAFGFISKLNYVFKDKLNNQISLQAEYLSGDKTGTGDKDEMFDVLWCRVPRLGETWAGAAPIETGGRAAQCNNFERLGLTWSISPTKTTSVATSYYAAFAPEAIPTRSTNNARFSRDGHFRGHQFHVIVKQKITKELSALVIGEAAFLGDYYTQRDTITFLRLELTYTF